MNGKSKLQECKEAYESVHMSEKQVKKMEEVVLKAKSECRIMNKVMKVGISFVAAAAVAVVVLPNTSASVAKAMGNIPILGSLVDVVTFRDYTYEDDRNTADIKVPKMNISASENMDEEAAKNMQNTVEEINAEMKKLADDFMKEFKENLCEEGYQNIIVNYEVVCTTKDYFTLKVDSYQATGSGAEWNNYYTIDLKTGKRLKLKELFVEGADYITLISDEIKKQMKQQMSEDENVTYFLESDMSEWNFNKITDETQFYINQEGNLVISFDEGDVAPMCMGIVTFEIPRDILAKIYK